MHLASDTFDDGGRMPPRTALAVPAEPGPVAFSENRNPHLSWSDVPDSTESFVITCIDRDCPSAPDDVNTTDREVPASLPRVPFVHWLLADIPSDVREIDEAAHSAEVTEGGKAPHAAPAGTHGRNDYTSWFDGDPEMHGAYHGYDGPAPPWNDSVVHRYDFTVHAIDVPSLGLAPGFTFEELSEAMDGHVLDSATITGEYASNPRLH